MFGLDPYSIALKVAIGLVVAGLSAFVMHRVDHAAYADLELKYAQAEVTAQKQSADLMVKNLQIAANASTQEAVAQQALQALTLIQVKEITRYVKDTSTCITYGLVRVLDAAALGVDPATLRLPSGQSNDACAPVTATTLAGSVIGNYGAARANAEQLNRLEATILALAPRP